MRSASDSATPAQSVTAGTQKSEVHVALLDPALLAEVERRGLGLGELVTGTPARSTRELAVRVALGARPAEVVRTVMGRGLGAVGVGLAAGVLLAVAIGRAMSALLYSVSAHDPVIYLAAPALLGVVAVASALVPAVRAARVDPIVALRDA